MNVPDVKREQLQDDGREKLILHADDAPSRPGYDQPKGTTEHGYLMSLPLSDGRRLELHLGKGSCDHFTAMLAAMATDDAIDQVKADFEIVSEAMAVNVFQMSDCDWWAGFDAESVKKAYVGQYDHVGLDAGESGMFADPVVLSCEAMDRLKFVYEPEAGRDSPRCSFRERLREMVTEDPLQFPCFFATTEY